MSQSAFGRDRSFSRMRYFVPILPLIVNIGIHRPKQQAGNYTDDIVWGALFPIHDRNSIYECGPVQAKFKSVDGPELKKYIEKVSFKGEKATAALRLFLISFSPRQMRKAKHSASCRPVMHRRAMPSSIINACLTVLICGELLEHICVSNAR